MNIASPSLWQSAVIYDQPDKVVNLEALTVSIAEASILPLPQKLIPFSKDRAIFFYSSPSKASKVINLSPILSLSSKIFQNSQYPLVNTFDSQRARFDGWIAIRGLPFSRWNLRNFAHIGEKFGGLLDINSNIKDLSIISEAKIRVKNFQDRISRKLYIKSWRTNGFRSNLSQIGVHAQVNKEVTLPFNQKPIPPPNRSNQLQRAESSHCRGILAITPVNRPAILDRTKRVHRDPKLSLTKAAVVNHKPGTRIQLHKGKVKQKWISKRHRGSQIPSRRALKNQQGIKTEQNTRPKYRKATHDPNISTSQQMIPQMTPQPRMRMQAQHLLFDPLPILHPSIISINVLPQQRMLGSLVAASYRLSQIHGKQEGSPVVS